MVASAYVVGLSVALYFALRCAGKRGRAGDSVAIADPAHPETANELAANPCKNDRREIAISLGVISEAGGSLYRGIFINMMIPAPCSATLHALAESSTHQSSPNECKPDRNMFTPRNAKVVTNKPITAHQAATCPRKPFMSRMCNQAA